MKEADKIEVIPVRKIAEDKMYEPLLHSREVVTPIAKLASQLIEKWGMVAALPDGEDASGRQKMRIMTPAEVVQRATQTAEEAYARFRAKGWIVELPTWSDLKDEADEALEAQEERSEARRNRRLRRAEQRSLDRLGRDGG